MDVYNEATQ